MPWRDRFYSSLPYALPLSAVIPLGDFVFRHFGIAQYIYFPFVWLYRNVLMLPIIPELGLMGELIVFIGLYALITRNERIEHFIRFNTMQALLLAILILIGQLFLRVISQGLHSLPSAFLLIQFLANTLFLGITAICIYAVVQSSSGNYSKIPAISEAALIQCTH